MSPAVGVERVELQVGPLRVDAWLAGPASGDLVLLLHGFPQLASSWSPQLEALAAAGFRAVAPNQRGYSPRARPLEIGAYPMDHLVDDTVGMADCLGAERFHLVGHDWGGAVAWQVTGRHPDRVRTLAVVSTPHPRALLRSLVTSLQPLRSAYVGFFQMPRLPELVLGTGHNDVLRRWLQVSGLDGERAREYAAALGQPGALTAALNWYRAAWLGRLRQSPRIRCPTLYVWSTRDPAVGGRAAKETARYVDGPYRFEVLEGVSHWVVEEHPEMLNRLLLDHVAAGT